jgi:hypothetical protein
LYAAHIPQPQVLYFPVALCRFYRRPLHQAPQRNLHISRKPHRGFNHPICQELFGKIPFRIGFPGSVLVLGVINFINNAQFIRITPVQVAACVQQMKIILRSV